ncbi:MAG: hypothetical protein HUJ77_08100 [Clostridium sp.]|uniref:hypothetical protein n=1 Tax=Clostridium sp. TaxID=1506 RepID=UPI0025BEFB40|nr:hypothetical protein [Clostridium sp.]MCF0148345.1 hypothetical protein [Clostridium sp.]
MKTKVNSIGLTERQKNIKLLREILNKKNPEDINVFTKYKNFTYVLNIVCTPYALYRIWKKGSPFTTNERITQTGVCIIYIFALISAILSL